MRFTNPICHGVQISSSAREITFTKLNLFFVYDFREGRRYAGGEFYYVWVKDRKTGELTPSAEALERFMKVNEVAEKDADSLTSEWKNLGVDCALEPLMEQFRKGRHF